MASFGEPPVSVLPHLTLSSRPSRMPRLGATPRQGDTPFFKGSATTSQPASQTASFRPHGERKHQLKALIIHHNFPECGTTTTITVPFIISGTCQCGCCSTPTAINGAECITLPRHSHTQTRRKTPVCVFPFFSLFSNFFFFLALLILFRGFVHQKGMKNTCPPID